MRTDHALSACEYFARAKQRRSGAAYAASAEGDALIISTYEDTILRYREAKARVGGGDVLVATVADMSVVDEPCLSSAPAAASYIAQGDAVLGAWYWDNCASVSIVNKLWALSDSEKLARPFHIGGVGSGCLVTFFFA